MPPAAICMSPIVDLAFGGESVISNRASDWLSATRLIAIRTRYLTGREPDDPFASPVHANLSGLPRLYIQAGSGELMYDDISAFAKKAKWAGVQVRFEIWEGMFHFWQIFGRQVPEARDAVARAGTFGTGNIWTVMWAGSGIFSRCCGKKSPWPPFFRARHLLLLRAMTALGLLPVFLCIFFRR